MTTHTIPDEDYTLPTEEYEVRGKNYKDISHAHASPALYLKILNTNVVDTEQGTRVFTSADNSNPHENKTRLKEYIMNVLVINDNNFEKQCIGQMNHKNVIDTIRSILWYSTMDEFNIVVDCLMSVDTYNEFMESLKISLDKVNVVQSQKTALKDFAKKNYIEYYTGEKPGIKEFLVFLNLITHTIQRFFKPQDQSPTTVSEFTTPPLKPNTIILCKHLKCINGLASALDMMTLKMEYINKKQGNPRYKDFVKEARMQITDFNIEKKKNTLNSIIYNIFKDIYKSMDDNYDSSASPSYEVFPNKVIEYTKNISRKGFNNKTESDRFGGGKKSRRKLKKRKTKQKRKTKKTKRTKRR